MQIETRNKNYSQRDEFTIYTTQTMQPLSRTSLVPRTKQLEAIGQNQFIQIA